MNSSDTRRPDRRQHETFEKRAREVWRDAARQIDPGTAGRLRAARRTALQEARSPQPRVASWLIPTGALAAIALATMMVWQPLPHAPPGAQEHLGTSVVLEADNELPPNAEQVDPTLYQNLDFYAWLAANHSQPATR